MATGLTDRQRRFVDAYATCRQGAKAAIAAGYSERSAASIASRLLKLPEVAAALARRTQAASSRGRTKKALSPLDYLMEVMNDPDVKSTLRVRAALGAAPYVHGRATELGKKEARQVAAKTIGSGRFASSAAPLKLVRPIEPTTKK